MAFIEMNFASGSATEPTIDSLVPILSSNISEEGSCIYSTLSTSANMEPFRAFDDVKTTRYSTKAEGQVGYIGFEFNAPKCVKLVYMDAYGSMKHYVIEASNDNTNYTILYEGDFTTRPSDNHSLTIVPLDNKNKYKSYRVRQTTSFENYGMSCWELKMYGF